ncbi:helix-turn-helix transcriptional regulator [Sulfitobacter pseudonitzschiae]|uniref:Helix-turn-helix transcriptional regulator n=1 Tax=Pseudosulfitobacter pseudonitzschiae TaxID=1402135 RepID=A0A9Q2P3S6_9RHOB|nr:helix-turn-helix transcriptional regulator [Pseudosulfitobacter pseudonitzschiae]MBM2293864.1 helix-turn-helix transcriptional regulator [Pseudosulfitobacter pseudonitzschiae]MBM2298781.1 helix-turn-helix transcriptional regulator [Pseudosulfitobacter pseudonitzschiae]MBM2303695.1 helix-turn-helix transcriptional regulator [Pseudosulfitobacter pseudonitzschiae]MBM2313478.1 helix-turn-helix transcriptional regulator [Pseudosulfitobacter pseudonitzschiae]MBM2318392.1 helix-turn-helix transcri
MTHPIDVHVGNRIRALRQSLKLTQSGLASQLGVTFQQIQKYETGANRVSASKLALISDVLDVPIGRFFPEGYQDRSLSIEERTLIDNYRSADDGSKASLLNIAAKIAEVAHA